MIESCTFTQFNLTFINTVDVLKYLEINLINDLANYNLLSKSRVTRDIKKLIYHHIFHGFSEYLLNTKTPGKSIFLLSKTESYSNLQLCKYFKAEQLKKCIDSVLSSLVRLLPISIYGYELNIKISDLSLEYDADRGEVREFVELVKNFQWCQNVTRSYYTFAKVRSFAKRNELTFLNERYFNQLKTKQLLIA